MINFLFAPKRGGWLNMLDIEIGAVSRQCHGRRISNRAVRKKEAAAWQDHRNAANAMVERQFIAVDARIKPKSIYTIIHPSDTMRNSEAVIRPVDSSAIRYWIVAGCRLAVEMIDSSRVNTSLTGRADFMAASAGMPW